jgi:hypothetical protein
VEENVRAQSEAQKKQVGDLIFLEHKNDLHYLRSPLAGDCIKTAQETDCAAICVSCVSHVMG